ncbi:hypothetical protein D3C78_1298320 [compost metagenome]
MAANFIQLVVESLITLTCTLPFTVGDLKEIVALMGGGGGAINTILPSGRTTIPTICPSLIKLSTN